MQTGRACSLVPAVQVRGAGRPSPRLQPPITPNLTPQGRSWAPLPGALLFIPAFLFCLLPRPPTRSLPGSPRAGTAGEEEEEGPLSPPLRAAGQAPAGCRCGTSRSLGRSFPPRAGLRVLALSGVFSLFRSGRGGPSLRTCCRGPGRRRRLLRSPSRGWAKGQPPAAPTASCRGCRR